jgi:hypothetical protein
VITVKAVIPICSPRHCGIPLIFPITTTCLHFDITAFTARVLTTGFNHCFQGNNLGSLPPLLSLFALVGSVATPGSSKRRF